MDKRGNSGVDIKTVECDNKGNTTTTNSNNIINNNNDNNKYVIQTIYDTVFLPPDDQFTVSPQAVLGEQNSHKRPNSQESLNSWTRVDSNLEKQEGKIPAPGKP